MPPLAEFLQRLAACCADDSFVRLTLSSPVAPQAAVQRIQARLIDLRGQRQLSCTLQEERRDTTENVPLAQATDWVGARLGSAFRSALLATTSADWQLQHADSERARLIRHRASATVVPPRSHDAAKPTFLGAEAQPWLHALGIVDAQGRPRPRLADKHAQIDRYVEILAHLAQDCGFANPTVDAPLRIVDVGCGKGHLTFAAWHLVQHVLRRRPAVLGVEARPELVAEANQRASALAPPGQLQFVRGDIGAVALPPSDALIALHACNTATDHAIRRGVETGARLIVVAPCCHQEVRPQLAAPEPLAAVLRHGLMAERMAEWATDGLRALVLEAAGYRTKVIEFVGSEHTGKNLMLAGVRREAAPDPAGRAAALAQIAAFRAFFGIERHALDPLLAAAR